MTDQMMRVHAGDLADIINDGFAARADYETCVRDATEAATQWNDQVNEVLRQFNEFRRGVQEALQIDQAELLHDGELVARVRHAATRGQATDPLPVRRRVVPMGSPSVGGMTVADMVAAVGEGAEVTLSPWLAPPEDVPSGDGLPVKLTVDMSMVRAHERNVAAQLERERQWEAGETQPDGTHALFQPDSQQTIGEGYKALSPDESSRTDPWASEQDPSIVRARGDQVAGQVVREQDGPPTESMQPVEDPPAVQGYKIGRVFHRGDPCPQDDEFDLVTNRSGDVMRVLLYDDGVGGSVMRQDGTSVEWDEQLHMNGTLWEILDTEDSAPVVEQAPDAVADHDH